MRNYSAKDVDSYIASAEVAARPILYELRKVIRSAVPNAEEGISWGVPFYKYYGLLGGFSVFKNHVTFGLAFVIDSKDREAFEKIGFTTGKKTVQIKFNQKVPVEMIGQIVKKKAKTNELERKVKIE